MAGKKNKKILLSIIILLIIIIITTILILFLNSKNNIRYIKEDEGRETKILDESLHKVTEINQFYTIKRCVEKFYNYYESIFNLEEDIKIMDEETENSIKEQKKSYIKQLYNMLDKEYINFNNITEDNLESKLEKVGIINVKVEDLYISEKNNRINIYIATGTIRETQTSKLSNFKIMLKADFVNKTFSIYLQDYIDKKYPNFKIGDSLNETVPEQIEETISNKYSYKIVSEESYAADLFERYRDEILHNKEQAFERLDEEYRTKRFETIDKFKTYTKSNTKKYVIMSAEKYQKTVKDDYTQYVYMDQNENYYIFRVKAPFDYTVILDTYTVDLPEFIEKYNSSTDEDKVLINIKKCVDAINNQDYKYMYNKLDEEYKKNYFKTLSDFEKYVKENFFTENKFAASNGQKQGEIYTYDITLTDSTKKETKKITKKFVMKLKEGTDFVMSFAV